jgi:hypothetical protein
MTTSAEPRERPILFSGPMVRAILAGQKTQTRRVCKQAMGMGMGTDPAASVHPDGSGKGFVAWWPSAVSARETAKLYPGDEGFHCPYGLPGDRLWVKETLSIKSRQRVAYRADMMSYGIADEMDLCTGACIPDSKMFPVKLLGDRGLKWRSSLLMPRWASRLILEVTAIGIERLHQISREDAMAEGIDADGGDDAHRNRSTVENFAQTWDHLNGKRPGCAWRDNPWVWVVSFKNEKTPPARGPAGREVRACC